MQAPYPPPTDRLHGVRVGMALLLTGSILLLAISVVLRLYAIHQANEQFRIEQQDQAVLRRLESLKASENYQACQSEAAKVPSESRIRDQALTLENECRYALIAATLQYSQTLANAGLLTDAIAEVQTITDRSATLQVQQRILTWSHQILQTAEEYYQDPNGRLQDAIDTAATVPFGSVLYRQAQTKIRDWQADWAANQTYWQMAQIALTHRQPEAALAQIQQITHPYWQQLATPLREAAYAEQSIRQPVDLSPEKSPEEQGSLAVYVPLLLPISLGLLLARLSLERTSS